MITIKPFRAFRPVPEKISAVASLPYDVMNSEEARERAKDNPDSYLHVTKPEIDFDSDIDPHDPAIYIKGAENLKRLIEDGILIRDDISCFYIYQLQMGKYIQTGLVAAASCIDYQEGRIKKHEYTRTDKELDRVKHVETLKAQTGPVFLMYKDQENIAACIREGMKSEPIYHFKAEYDVIHTVYKIDDKTLITRIVEAFKQMNTLYIADGHHRSAAAATVQRDFARANPNHTGNESYNFYLTVIFPDSQLRILDYNRVIKDLNGLSKKELLDAIRTKFNLEEYHTNTSEKAFRPFHELEFGMYLEKQWYKLNAKPGTFNTSDPVANLDISVLHDNLLTPILGIGDCRTDQRIHFVGGIRGLGELEKLVDSGEYKIAFSLFPTPIKALMAVSDADRVMPPKSTWFEPKLLSGIFTHKLDSLNDQGVNT